MTLCNFHHRTWMLGSALFVALCGQTAVATVGAAQGRTPTFNADAAPILYAHCAGCHRAGEIGAAQSLLGYDSAKRWAAAIAQQVRDRQMPPWPADPTHSLKFRNDARLSQHDVDTLVQWVAGGAPQGSGDPPPAPVVAPKWLYPGGRAPDAVVKLPEVAVAATGEVPYVQQRVQVPLTADKWIIAMQVLPGNNALVHHMGITEVALANGVSPADLDALTKVARQMGVPDDALTSSRPAVNDEANGAYDMLGVYTPGTTFEMYANDSAKLLKSGNGMYINFNIHYTTTGIALRNHSELALWFQDARPKHQLFRAPAAVGTLIANGRQLLTDDPGTKAEGTDVAIPPIPPYADNYELIGMTAYTEPLIIYQLQPHAHMRGKDFKYTVVYPDGHEITLLTVPRYDFHWQLAYDLETPLRVPAGSKLVVTAHYDNSPANKHLSEVGVDPANCGPDKEAYFRRQNQSWHEMFSPLVQYAAEPESAMGSKARLVEAVGCLAQGAGATWSVTHASFAADTRSQSTSASALRSSAKALPGAQTYQLLGAGVFHPRRAENARVAVKGVLVGDDATRLNVTSLQKVGGSCP